MESNSQCYAQDQENARIAVFFPQNKADDKSDQFPHTFSDDDTTSYLADVMVPEIHRFAFLMTNDGYTACVSYVNNQCLLRRVSWSR